MKHVSTWEDFVRVYGKQICGVAHRIARRWMTPLGVSHEDVVQEVWLGAWLAWERWEEGRGGMSRAAFALCSGRLDAQRWVHIQRNAPRRSGAAEGRFPLAETVVTGGAGFDADGEEAPALFDRAIEPGQEVAVAFGEAVRAALRACRTRSERRVLHETLFAGSAGAAAEERVWRAYEEAR